MALELLDLGGDRARGPATIVGDNLPVVRYCADAGRLRRSHLHTILDGPLAARACSGCSTEWLAVRRRFNTAADAAATEACERAAQAAEAGRLDGLGITIRH